MTDYTRKKRVPISTFSTQYRPILNGLAQVAVLEEFANVAVAEYTRPHQDPRERSAIGTIYKASMARIFKQTTDELIPCLGWRGLMDYNQISESVLAYQGHSIAEGDILVLSIRLASELLQGKYAVAPATDPSCLLARHEVGLFTQLCALISSLPGDHRSDHFNSHILPHSRGLVEAIGHRMAFEAAVSASVDPELLALFEINCVMNDMSWYVENMGMTRAKLFEKEARATSALLPRLKQLVESLGAKQYVTAPIVSQEQWEMFVHTLPAFRGEESNGVAQDWVKVKNTDFQD